jgi:VanZ family protein
MLLSTPISMRWNWLNWPAPARRLTTFVFLVSINWLFLAPAGTFQDVHIFLSHQDKIAHFCIFGLLAGLIRWSIPADWGEGKRRLILAGALIGYGAAIECVQLLLPELGRSFEWMDLLMDTLGVVIGLWVCGRLAR